MEGYRNRHHRGDGKTGLQDLGSLRTRLWWDDRCLAKVGLDSQVRYHEVDSLAVGAIQIL